MQIRIKALVLVVLTMWLGPPDGAEASDMDMSIDEAIIAAYDSIPVSNRSNNPNLVRVELDMIYRLEVWESMMREEDSPRRRKRRKAVQGRELLWPNAVVPYELEATFSAANLRVIRNAMQHYEKYTCIRFRPKTLNDTEFVKLVDNNGCSSEIGRQRLGQELSLALHCRQEPTVIHELGHAIGLMHEHSRPDRDDYIIINETNLLPQFSTQFSRSTPMAMDVGGIPYDYLSIMHYSQFTGSNGNIVITTRDQRYQNEIGKQKRLSFRDAKLINRMYRCLERNECRWKFCPGEGFVGHDCQCWCPSTNNLTVAEHCPREESEKWLSQQISAIKKKSNRTVVYHPHYWPNATVPYITTEGFGIDYQNFDMLPKAFELFQTYSCLRFREAKTSDVDYIQIVHQEGACWSFLGRAGDTQNLTFSSSCRKMLSTCLHLLSHTVGVRHEHQRPDRDDYITVNIANIHRDFMYEFEKDSSEVYTGVPYNYRSIMHYGEKVYSRNGFPTIVAKNASYQKLMGRSPTFTFGDVKRLNLMYQCAELRNCSQFIRCPGSGFVGQDCKCWCPPPDSRVPAVHCTECTDFEEMCPLLSEYGYCMNNKFEEYMKYTCPRSCGVCSPITPA